jgi:hypothetical protein
MGHSLIQKGPFTSKEASTGGWGASGRGQLQMDGYLANTKASSRARQVTKCDAELRLPIAGPNLPNYNHAAAWGRESNRGASHATTGGYPLCNSGACVRWFSGRGRRDFARKPALHRCEEFHAHSTGRVPGMGTLVWSRIHQAVRPVPMLVSSLLVGRMKLGAALLAASSFSSVSLTG